MTQEHKQDCNTQGRFDRSRFGSPAGWLAAGTLICAPLICAPTGPARAQANAAAPAAALAPSSAAASAPLQQKPAVAAPAGPVTLPPQPPAPQFGGPAATAPAGVQTPNQTASQGPNQPPAATPDAAPGQPNQSASLPAPPDSKRGFLNDLGKWWDDSVANFNAKMKEQQAKLDEFNKEQSAAAKDATQAMKNAADAMFTPSKVIEVQQPCPVAGNGAPDCAGAASNVCKAKGFSDGRPMDIRTAERCKASLWVSGQAPTAADCPIETVLLRVACQP